MDLDEVADELYGVPPEEFIPLRKTRQDEAKADGDKALATEIGALPKPSTPAWVCNLLVRAHRGEIEGLVDLGNLLREAQQNLAGDELKALDVQRRQLLTALTRRARAVAYERGHSVSTAVATQVEETLRAAMSDPGAGEALLSGRLTAPMSYSGMGELTGRPELRLVSPPRPEPRVDRAPAKRAARKNSDEESTADRRRRQQEERQRAAEEKRRRELAVAQEAADAAAAAAEEAESALEEHRRVMDELTARRAELRARAEVLADQLAEVERAAAEAATALRREERRVAAAEREVAEAVDARDSAVARVAQLTEGTPG